MDIDLDVIPETLDWLDLAECRHLDLHEFFPEPGHHATDAAKDACARCPVKRQCLDHVQRLNIRHGYVAGSYWGRDHRRTKR